MPRAGSHPVRFTLPRLLDEGDGFDEEADAEALVVTEEPAANSDERTADEIAQAEAEKEGVDPLHLESLENGIEVSMREARVKLAELRKDRGYKGPSSTPAPNRKGRGKTSGSIAAKKASGNIFASTVGSAAIGPGTRPV